MHILDSVYFKHNIKLPKLHYRAKAGCLDSYNHLCLLKQRLQCLMFVRQWWKSLEEDAINEMVETVQRPEEKRKSVEEISDLSR